MEYDTFTKERIVGGWKVTWTSDMVKLAVDTVKEAIAECEKIGNDTLKSYLESDLAAKTARFNNIIYHVARED